MKKLLLTILVLTLVSWFSFLSYSFSTDYSEIPKGTWVGNLASTGEVHCNANIYKIIVEDSTITLKGIHIPGPLSHSFNIGESKIQSKTIQINNIYANFYLSLSKDRNTLRLNFDRGCHGEANFKLANTKKAPVFERDKKAKEEKNAGADIKKETTRLEDMLIIAKTTCEEIGISDTDPKYGKCVLTILKKPPDSPLKMKKVFFQPKHILNMTDTLNANLKE